MSTPPGRATSDDDPLSSLQASEARLRAALEASFDSFFFLEPIRDEAGKIVDFSYLDLNAHGASILKLPREQVIGQTFRALNPSILVEPILERCVRVLGTGVPLREEFAISRADGSVVWVYHHIFPIGRGVASTVHNITERKRAEEERRLAEESLRQTQQRLAFTERMASVGTLAAGAAHEINNPLAAMIMNLGFVADSLSALLAASPEARQAWEAREAQLHDAAETVRTIQQSAERLRRIVRDLMIFSQAGTDARKLTDVRQVLRECVRMVQNELQRRARLAWDEGPVPLVMASEGRLGQVFLNLLTNAAHAIPEGAADQNEIALVTRTDPAGRAVIEIRDTGQGMTPEVEARIFDPFFTTRSVGEGMGLGLSVCYGVVTGLGGEIQVETEPGRGSLLRVLLPPSGARPTPPAPEPGPRPAGASLTARAEDPAPRR